MLSLVWNHTWTVMILWSVRKMIYLVVLLWRNSSFIWFSWVWTWLIVYSALMRLRFNHWLIIKWRMWSMMRTVPVVVMRFIVKLNSRLMLILRLMLMLMLRTLQRAIEFLRWFRFLRIMILDDFWSVELLKLLCESLLISSLCNLIRNDSEGVYFVFEFSS